MLRRWRPEDRAPFAALNADPEVVEHLPRPLTPDESDTLAEVLDAELATLGYGFWAVEVVGGAPFVGFVGIRPVPFDASFTPAVEVGWRLGREHWGHGYASEAARAAVDHGLRLGLAPIVSFTVVDNVRSRAVMERIGMVTDPAEDFDHPNLPPGDRLCRHVLYRFPPGTTATS